MTTQIQQAERFLALHRGPQPLLLPNPWDLGSAKLLAWLGFPALATTSSGFAATMGRPDGEVTRDEALAHAAAITEATGLPSVAGATWVLLLSANPETRVSCLTTKDRVSADMLHMHPEDLDRFVAEVCSGGPPTSATQSTQPSFFPGHP